MDAKILHTLAFKEECLIEAFHNISARMKHSVLKATEGDYSHPQNCI